jgi:hypothetical protein
MRKKIVRWTVGNATLAGKKCLKKSIKSFIDCYGSDFDFYICYNKEKPVIADIHNVQINFYQQTKTFIFGHGAIWKYTPPRLDINSHEMWVDNDIIFVRPSNYITEFFKSNKPIICEDFIGWYGRYHHKIKPKPKINSGIFGFPPSFDFGREILKHWNASGNYGSHWSDDEQGLTALVITNQEHMLIPKEIAPTIHSKGLPNPFPHDNDRIMNFKEFKWDTEILHFVGLNRIKKHEYYSQLLTKLL